MRPSRCPLTTTMAPSTVPAPRVARGVAAGAGAAGEGAVAAAAYEPTGKVVAAVAGQL